MEEKHINAIKEFTETVMATDSSGHGMDHIIRVVKMAERIAKTENCNQDIVIAAAYLHDTVDDKLVASPEAMYKKVEQFLQENGISQDEIHDIFHIMKNMSFSKTFEGTAEPLSLEGKIVQDADRLDALGAMGVVRTIYYGGYKGNKIYDPHIPPRRLQSKKEYRQESTIINHFYEKLLLLKDYLNTDYAKKVGARRQQFLELFLAEFLDEWENEEE